MARQVRIEILGDARGLRKAFGEADRATTGFAKGIGRAGLVAATGLAGIVAGVGAAAFKSVQAAQESNKVGRQTAAVIKSTGGAARVTAKQVGDLSTAISNKTGIDDEQVQASQNMLLTFTNIRNAAGRNNDIFTQATRITQDMSVALGQDGTRSAIQLGKALNDPVRGVTALTKVGVTFTAKQKEQIKSLVDSGRTMDAQRLILRELGREFGGSAEAAATPLDRLKVVVGNVSESVGNLLLPIVDKAANWLGARLPGAVTLLQTGLRALGAAFRGGGVTSTGFVGVMERIGVALRVIIPAVQRFAAEQLPRLQHAAELAGRFIVDVLIPGLVAIFGWINDHKTLVQSLAVGILAIVAAVKVWTLVTRTMAAVQAVLNVVLSANPIGLIILAIAGLAAGLIYAYHHSETFRKIVDGAFRAVLGVITAVWDWVKGHWPLLLGILTGPIGAAAILIIRNWDKIKTGVAAVITFIIGGVRNWFNVTASVVAGILHVMGRLPGPMGAPFRAAEAAVRKAKDTVNAQLDAMQRKINGLRGKAVDIKVNWSQPHAGLAGLTVKIQGGPMAAGGPVRGPGGPRDDRAGLFALSNREFVQPAAATDYYGLPFMEAVRSRRFPRMADGGYVGTLRYFDQMQRDMGPLATRLGVAWGKVLQKAGGAGSPAIKAFIRSADALPYVWGATGPGAFDCSGLVGAVYGKMRGDPAAGRGRRYFTTGSIGTGVAGLKPGLGGVLNIGVTPGVGHMAGSYGGLGFEARSTATGIFTGAAARPPASFARRYHMAGGGMVKRLDPRTVDWLARQPGIDVGGDPGKLRVERFDRGGYLAPHSATLALNGTGRPEPVGAGGGVTLERGAVQILAAPGMDERKVAELAGAAVVRALDERDRRVRKGRRA